MANNISSVDYYNGILKQKYIKKDINNNYFYYSNDFLQMIIEVLVIALYIHLAKYSTIDSFYIGIERSDWFFLIENIEKNYLGITKVCSI